MVFNFELWQTLVCNFKRIVSQIQLQNRFKKKNENNKSFSEPRLATLLERVNNKKFKVNIKNIFLIYFWVIVCLQVGEYNGQSSVKCWYTLRCSEISDTCLKQANLATMLLKIKC